MTITIVGVFIICWTPYNVMCIWYVTIHGLVRYNTSLILWSCFIYVAVKVLVGSGLGVASGSTNPTRTVSFCLHQLLRESHCIRSILPQTGQEIARVPAKSNSLFSIFYEILLQFTNRAIQAWLKYVFRSRHCTFFKARPEKRCYVFASSM